VTCGGLTGAVVCASNALLEKPSSENKTADNERDMSKSPMSSISIDYIVYCRRFAEIALSWRVGEGRVEECCDPFSSEDLVPVVDLSGPDHGALVPRVLVSRGRRWSFRSNRFCQRNILARLKAASVANRKRFIYLSENACPEIVRLGRSAPSAKLINWEDSNEPDPFGSNRVKHVLRVEFR
jgi:hypothetical protein